MNIHNTGAGNESTDELTMQFNTANFDALTAFRTLHVPGASGLNASSSANPSAMDDSSNANSFNINTEASSTTDAQAQLRQLQEQPEAPEQDEDDSEPAQVDSQHHHRRQQQQQHRQQQESHTTRGDCTATTNPFAATAAGGTGTGTGTGAEGDAAAGGPAGHHPYGPAGTASSLLAISALTAPSYGGATFGAGYGPDAAAAGDGYEPRLGQHGHGPIPPSATAPGTAAGGATMGEAGVSMPAMGFAQQQQQQQHRQQQRAYSTLQREVNRQFDRPFTNTALSLEEYRALLKSKHNSLDFFPTYNSLQYKAAVAETPSDVKWRRCCHWTLTALVGIVVGLYCFVIIYITRRTNGSKFGYTAALLADGNTAASWALFSFWNTGFLLVCAFLINYIIPSAASGIPDIKAYLNGTNVPGSFTLTALGGKVIATYLCVSASMPIGAQGPLTHTGALIGYVFYTLLQITIISSNICLFF